MKRKSSAKKQKITNTLEILAEVKKSKSYDKVLKVLEQDPALKDILAHNLLLQQLVFLQNTPWSKCNKKWNGEVWQEKDTYLLMKYCLNNYGFTPSKSNCEDAIRVVAHSNGFNPLQKYLEALPKWDKVGRIATIFTDYLGVEDNSYTRELGQIFVIGLVKRAYESGCTLDHMVILQGEQGIGKSSFFRILGGEWFSDGLTTFDGKTAIEQILGAWLVEVAELQAFIKADVSAPKSFITRKEDKARMAYERNTAIFPRIAVIVGTTNEDDFLRDITGNRRFCPLTCTKALDFVKLKANRDQIFAEALYFYNEYRNSKTHNDFVGYPLIDTLSFVSPEAKRLAEEARQQAEYIDTWQDIIANFLENEEEITTKRLCRECLGLANDKISPANSKRIAGIMHKLGWEKCRFGDNRIRGYKKSNSLS